MGTYTVLTLVNASISEDVEADNAEGAIGEAEPTPGLCHQCSDSISTADPHGYIVIDEGGNVVHDDSDAPDPAAALREAVGLLKRWLDLDCISHEDGRSHGGVDVDDASRLFIANHTEGE